MAGGTATPRDRQRAGKEARGRRAETERCRFNALNQDPRTPPFSSHHVLISFQNRLLNCVPPD